MSMLEKTRRSRGEDREDREDTVRVAARDFRRRRRLLARRGWRRRLLIGLVVLLVAGIVAGGVWLVFWSSYLTVRGVEFTGNTSISSTRLERAAAVPVGTPLARADLDAVRRRVEAVPAVRSAEVSRSWPHQVHVAVTERLPIAVVNLGEGLQAVDAEGVLFGHFDSRPARYPLMRTQPDLPAEALAEGAKVVAALPTSVAPRVDMVEVDSIDQISLVLRSGRRVLWGSAQDSDEKAAVLADLLPLPGDVIDVTVPGRPTTK